MRLPALLATSAALAVSVGCAQSIDYVDPVNSDFFSRAEGGSDLGQNIRDARLSGQFGPVETFDDAPATSSGYDDGASTNLVVETERNGRLGMLIIDSWNGSLLNMPAGRYTSSSSDMNSDLYVNVCATDFDAPASDAEVIIEDRPDGTRVVTVEAEVDGEYGVDNRQNPAIASFNIVP
jgi:hypothetical protein